MWVETSSTFFFMSKSGRQRDGVEKKKSEMLTSGIREIWRTHCSSILVAVTHVRSDDNGKSAFGIDEFKFSLTFVSTKIYDFQFFH